MKQRNFTKQDQISILQLINTPGWNVLLQIMEDECEVTETKLLQLPNDEHNKVLGFHAIAKAKRSFFENIQKEVFRLSKVGDTEARPRELTQEEIIKAQFQEIE